MGRETAPPEGEEDMEKTVEQETAKTFQRTRMVVMAAAFAALACVATMVVKVPSPTGGYMNLGDTVVLLGGYLLGPAWGALAGSIGPALADVLLGSPIYAPATLVIKAGMAALAARRLRRIPAGCPSSPWNMPATAMTWPPRLPKFTTCWATTGAATGETRLRSIAAG